MKSKKTALVLAIVAGVLCFGVFGYKYIKRNKLDYTILVVGIFVTSLGISSYYTKQNNKP